MIPLLTGNPKKYAEVYDLLEGMRISVSSWNDKLPELQHLDQETVVAEKAVQARELLGRICIVDDSGLYLDAYPGFPGPLTRMALKLLGCTGFQKLLSGVSDRAMFRCYLACAAYGTVSIWQGEVAGRLLPGKCSDTDLPLSSWFILDSGERFSCQHRREALCALSKDVDRLQAAVDAEDQGL